MVTLTAPYIAGFLAFRETPFLLEALQRLERNQPTLMPQVVFVDGNGLFHYREFGLACHLGVLSALPCVGVAKNLLQVQGVYKSEEHQSQIAALQKGGDCFPLTAASGKVLGKALRSSDKSSKPVYVSVGHKISLDTAVRLTHSCCHYRVPEPIRQYTANQLKENLSWRKDRVRNKGIGDQMNQKLNSSAARQSAVLFGRENAAHHLCNSILL
ncbi:endonuclease V-like isoform X4 [Channa argus]